MKIKIKDNLLAVRLYQGECVVEMLSQAFKESGKSLGVILSGTGMMKNIRIRYFLGKGQYRDRCIEQPMEVVSMTGNIINSSDGLFSHFHVSLADSDNRVLGGHLSEAEVHCSGEYLIVLSDIKASRIVEEDTGLKGFKI